ncbi:MAG: hypothetical protein CL521_06335, partial [Actinobacteria bacterium]|nr:hypothetical protein [Actinomycetota bacterium]
INSLKKFLKGPAKDTNTFKTDDLDVLITNLTEFRFPRETQHPLSKTDLSFNLSEHGSDTGSHSASSRQSI